MSRVAKVDDAQNVSMTKAVRSPNFMPPRAQKNGKFRFVSKIPFVYRYAIIKSMILRFHHTKRESMPRFVSSWLYACAE